MVERVITFSCAGERLIGILSDVVGKPRLGVIVSVGGPQYRVGSHRQFVLLARRLAEEGIPVLRFDYRGMGDSTGATQSFQDCVPDIATAIDALKAACPSVDHIVLWGLCDAASAALLYWHATGDSRVAGVVLLNPWVRSAESLARTHIKHYYGHRILQREFWTRLARGGVNLRVALRSFAGTALAASAARDNGESEPESAFQYRMASAMASFAGPILLVLSGHDLTAKEFLDHTRSSPHWRGLIERGNVERCDLPEADHTFSGAASRQCVEALTLDWLKRSFRMMP